MRTTTFAEDAEELAARLLRKMSTADIEKLSEVVLMDQRSGTAVSHRDVGIGISQVLPVLVTAYAARNELLAIEQPEIHLHPALQADLGDVLIESALGERNNRLLIETHSEHIILRVMRRMRETAKKQNRGRHPVRPNDVAVLYVQRDDSRAVALELRLDDDGALLDPWPGGFFEEGFRERFGLAGE
jgi:predicted ATPase